MSFLALVATFNMIEFGQPFYSQPSRVGVDSLFNHWFEIRVSKCKVPLDSYLASPLRSVEQPKNHFFINLNLILTLLLLVKGKAYVIYAKGEDMWQSVMLLGLSCDICKFCLCLFFRNLVSASQDGKLIVWDSYTTNKVCSVHYIE